MIGWLVAVISCGMPLWHGMKVSQETSLCDADGLQMLKCMLYNSLTVLPQDLKESGVLMVICIIITSLGLLLYVIGDKLITCVLFVNVKAKIKMVARDLLDAAVMSQHNVVVQFLWMQQPESPMNMGPQ
ncbi:hypothetical protein A6R68_17978 [Neotoma lepida]|uniref:Uncharacterized protein n=1 Tax=Neotoma lepida TaxID=56216 RepID=A0A1A6HB97_NEOLE|nr:hypothetical protein A6R68_17978 [Neotoma lepida]